MLQLHLEVPQMKLFVRRVQSQCLLHQPWQQGQGMKAAGMTLLFSLCFTEQCG